MKITAINGSPRGIKSTTFLMLEEILKGAKNKNANTEQIILSNKNIHHCIGCFSCWLKTPGVCVFKDDMSELLSKIKDTDIIIFASPLYCDNISGLLKNFLDRSISFASPYIQTDPSGEGRHIIESEKSPKIIVVSNCGFAEQTHFQTLNLFFKRLARNMGTEVIAEIYRSEGPLLTSGNLLLKPLIYKYKKLLQKAGEEIVEIGRLSEKTKTDLEKPLISPETYYKEANKHFRKILEENK